jgi:general secretion pathway protein J
MDRRQSRKHSGFTLVEVLVALMIMALMAAMAWQGVDGVVRSRNDSQARLEQTLRLNTVVAQWEQDLGLVQDTGAAPGLQFDGVSLRMTRSAPGGMQVVVWSLRPSSLIGGTTGTTATTANPPLKGEVLQRWAGPVVTSKTDLQEQWFRSLQFLGGEPGQLSTMSGLSTWQIYFFQGNAWANAQSTGNSANPGNPGSGANPGTSGIALPTGVRLVMTFAEGSGTVGSLTRDCALTPH